LDGFLQVVGKERALQLFGIRLIGISVENAKKLLFTVLFLLVLWGLNWLARKTAARFLGEERSRASFWTTQILRIVFTFLLITGLISIWFNDPGRLASAAGLITAGLAIASQRVITAVSAYFIILRSKSFDVGDRIVMGGVRGDVIALSFIQTTIMEMGQPPAEQGDAPSMWVTARQYTGRIVTVSNDKIFDEPVYNYTRDFPYIWEEMRIPIPYGGDRKRAEQIMLEATKRRTGKIAEMGEEALKELERRYAVDRAGLEPRVFYHLTDNWIQMTVRFVTSDHHIREVKDAISRDILQGFEEAKISIASGTYEVVGMPELQVRLQQ